MEFIEKTQIHDKDVLEIIKGWGSDIIVSRGKIYRTEDLEGILVYENQKIIGIGLYYTVLMLFPLHMFYMYHNILQENLFYALRFLSQHLLPFAIIF